LQPDVVIITKDKIIIGEIGSPSQWPKDQFKKLADIKESLQKAFPDKKVETKYDGGMDKSTGGSKSCVINMVGGGGC
jgi:hypothetical protein